MQDSLPHTIKRNHDQISKNKHEKNNLIQNCDVLMYDQEKKRHYFLNALSSMCKERNTIAYDKRKLKVIEKAKIHSKEQES